MHVTSRPAVLGFDMAGTVEALGPDVTKFKVGDEVYGMAGGVGGIQERSRSLRQSISISSLQTDQSFVPRGGGAGFGRDHGLGGVGGPDGRSAPGGAVQRRRRRRRNSRDPVARHFGADVFATGFDIEP